jgi:homoserine O-acetyltransferase
MPDAAVPCSIAWFSLLATQDNPMRQLLSVALGLALVPMLGTARLPQAEQDAQAAAARNVRQSVAHRGSSQPRPTEGDVVLRDFRFASGQSLAALNLHYRSFGQPMRGRDGKVTNAVLVLHGTGGAGSNFVEGTGGPMFAGKLFGKGQLLDADRYYIIIPDNIGHGKSSKPSDGLHARFPRYGYEDMIRAQYLLLAELKIDHLRLVLGTSMGGMHTWLWGQRHPDYMDALMPLASLPTQISGRNRMWRRIVIDAIRTDPEWKNGDYQTQPHGLHTAAQMLSLMSGNPLMRQNAGPTRKAADALIDQEVARRLRSMDANDTLYAVESSFDYDPQPGLEKVRAPLLAINFADDLINPPELQILEREIKRVPQGRAIVVPASAETVGHGTHTKAAVWKGHLEKFLKETER